MNAGRIEARVVTAIDGKSAACPFCAVNTRFSITHSGMRVEYQAKCPHVWKVLIDHGIHIYFADMDSKGIPGRG